MPKIYLAEYETCDLSFQGDLIKSKLYILHNANVITLTNDAEEADIIIFNANCACTLSAINNSISYFMAILAQKSPKAKTILTGCMARTIKSNESTLGKIKDYLKENFDAIYEINEYNQLLQDLFPTINFGNTKSFGCLNIFDPEVADIYISNGCNNSCTFCKTNFMNFPVKSMSLDEYKHQVDLAVFSGVKEIRLNGTNIAQVGLDTANTPLLPEFIQYAHAKKEIEEISLVGLAFKNAMAYGIDDVIKCSSKVKAINASIESGSNDILKLMNKGVTREEIIAFMDKIRQRHHVYLYTNIISGFPTEKLADVNETISLLNMVKPKGVLVSNYIDSPFIASHNLPQLTPEEIKEHTEIYKSELKRLRIRARYQ